MNDQDVSKPEEEKGQGLFPPTRWTRIRQAGNGDQELSRAAIDEICRAYWYPLFVMARRKHGMGHHHAEDITQGFWVWVLTNEIITCADPERGRFRNFLLICFDRYIHHEWRKGAAQKRGGAAPHISIQSEDWNERFEREMGAFSSPDEHLEHAWESASLEIAFTEVAAAWAALGKSELFATLKAHLADGAGHGGIALIAADHGMTEVNVRQQLFRLRKELRAAGKRWLKKAE